MDLRKLTIRRFKENDAAAVSKLIRENLQQVNSKDYSEEVINYMCELYTPKYIFSISQKRKMYVAVCEDKILGTASIDYDTLYMVFVDVQYHSKGIGQKLIALLEEIAENNGLRTLKVPASITAREFYEKLGYEFVNEVESKEFGKGIIMEKVL